MKALILAAHGSSDGDRISSLMRQRVAELAARDRFDEVLAAFCKEPPLLRDALRSVRAEEVFVVPFFTSSGWYSKRVLPREMGLTGPLTRCDGKTIRLTEPVGEHPWVTGRMATLGRRAVEANGFVPERTALVLVGHGSARHDHSGDAAGRHASRLRRTTDFGQIEAVFLNQPPEIERILELTALPDVAVVPHLIGGSIHLTRDLPRRLGVRHDDAYPPPPAVVRGRRVAITESPFEDRWIDDVILDLVNTCEIPSDLPAATGFDASMTAWETPA